jgi:hypothetical protein
MMTNREWIKDGIRNVCEKFKDRSAGSEAESACQDFFADEFKQWADEVQSEPFSLHPKAFLGSIPMVALLGIGSVILFWLSNSLSSYYLSILCCIFAVLSFIIWITESGFYRHFIDFVFPKRESKNVIAIRKACKSVEKRIIFAGHADAAYEMRYLVHSNLWMVSSIIGGSDIGTVFMAVCSIIQLFLNKSSTLWLVLGITGILFAVFFLLSAFFINWRVVTDGANDNLSGCYVGMGILREMAETKKRFEHTEVCCLITGGEESGLRGALNYAKRHKEELTSKDTIVIVLDTLHEISQLQVYTRGINFTQKNSEEACELLRQAGRKAGIELPNTKYYPGATDAEAFSRYGIKASALCAVRHAPTSYYHTRYDTWDNVSLECIYLAMDICKEAAELFNGKMN